MKHLSPNKKEKVTKEKNDKKNRKVTTRSCNFGTHLVELKSFASSITEPAKIIYLFIVNLFVSFY